MSENKKTVPIDNLQKIEYDLCALHRAVKNNCSNEEFRMYYKLWETLYLFTISLKINKEN